MQTAVVREGYVEIHRKAKNKFFFTGLNVIGRSRTAGLNYGNRDLVPAHNAPEWFLKFCEEFAETRMKVNVRVTRLIGGLAAEVTPLADSREAALEEYGARYGARQDELILPPTETPLDSSYENAFKAHRLKALEEGFTVVREVKEGWMSYTIVRKDAGPRRCIIRGGMLVGKVVKEFLPMDPKWRQAFRSFVRIQPHDNEE